MEVKKLTMEKVEVPFHNHRLISFTRFCFNRCEACCSLRDFHETYIYGGYRCNEPGCDTVVFHKECVDALPEMIHSHHPYHPLKLILSESRVHRCSLCLEWFKVVYCCSLCDIKLDLKCARKPAPLVIPGNPYGHEHPLELSCQRRQSDGFETMLCCKVCHSLITSWEYRCHECKSAFHPDCVNNGPEAYHTSHSQHPLKSLKREAPDYADKNCLLCATEFDQLHHCDVCNFSICKECMRNPPPLGVLSPTTHAHQLHLIPRCIHFICNACGTLGDRSPYFCLQCNFMIHWECMDLPRVININRHDHRISYTRRLGYGEWKCRVCRKQVDGFYGAYSCSKCPTYVVHSRCATRRDVWDMVELEGTLELEEIAPFEVINDNTIKHFSHNHNLQINKDGEILLESIGCAACVFQIISEPFYSCRQCDFILHEKCANLPQRKRHVCNNQPFTLHTDSHHSFDWCSLCEQHFTGFRYKTRYLTIDVQCGSMTDSLMHHCHPHPLFYSTDDSKRCSGCGNKGKFSCDECDFSLDYACAILPQKVMRRRYDDHPLFLSYGESSVDSEYWCEACEAKVNPKKWFYTCNYCGITLHIACVRGDLSHVMPGTCIRSIEDDAKVVANTSICRPLCCVCNSRCMLQYILSIRKATTDEYICSYKCRRNYGPDAGLPAQARQLRLQKKIEFNNGS